MLTMPAVYDNFAKYYDRFFAPLEWLGLSRRRCETLSFLPKDGSILEIGCGAGANFAFYPHSRLSVSSEISSKMLEIARQKRGENHLIQADAQCLPFAENQFDAAFATLVFCSIPDPNAAFAEVRRVVKPGGKLVMLEHVRPPNPLGHAFDIFNKLTVRCFDDRFNRETLETAMEAGFQLVDVQRMIAGVVIRMVLSVNK